MCRPQSILSLDYFKELYRCKTYHEVVDDSEVIPVGLDCK
jgi:hypothetical protein